MARTSYSFSRYLTRPRLPRESAADALILLQQHIDFSKNALTMAVIMSVNVFGAAFVVNGWNPDTNIEWWIGFNLLFASLLVVDAIRKRGRAMPKKVSGSYLMRSEYLAIVFGAFWGSLPYFIADGTGFGMIVAGLMIPPMAAGMSSMLTRVPRIVMRYGLSACVASYSFVIYEFTIPAAAVGVMMMFFLVALFLGVRNSFQAYRSDIFATLKAEESRDLLMGALEASNQAFAIFDANGHTVVENELHERIFTTIEDPFEPKTRPVKREGMFWQRSVHNIPGVGTVVVHTDVTRIEEARAELETARYEAEAANQAKTRFLGSMSTELKAPLDIISACAGVLGSASNIESSEEDVRNYADKIAEQAMILSSTLDGIIRFTHLERDDYLPQMSEVAIRDTVHSVVGKLSMTSSGQGNPGVDVHVPAGLIVSMDASSLEVILRNLLKNAMESGATSPVIVKASVIPHEGVVMMIRDRGRGMASDVLERAFEPFFHARTKSKFDDVVGVGLGLSVAKRLADENGCKLRLQSKAGEGTTAFITIPDSLLIKAPAEVLDAPSKDCSRQGCRLDPRISSLRGAARLEKLHLFGVVRP